MFEIEKGISEKSNEEKFATRQEKSKAIADEFFAWADEQLNKILPKSLAGTAVQYALNQKKYLLSFLKDGRLEMSNNRAERSIKPFVIGRKNWLFCNTPNGAKSAAIIYSIIETAKENNLKHKEFIFEIQTGQELMQKHSEKLESGRLKLGGVKIDPTELYVVVEGIKAPISQPTFIDAYCDVEGTQHGNFNSGNDVYKGLDGPGSIEHKGNTYIWAIFNELEIL